jgi:hypothetical protein
MEVSGAEAARREIARGYRDCLCPRCLRDLATVADKCTREGPKT